MFDDDVPRYKKKVQKKTPQKSKHKHEYVYCVFGFNKLGFSKERGFEPRPDISIGTYCPECGKVGTINAGGEWIVEDRGKNVLYGFEWSAKARAEFNPITRTLPYFWLDDYWRTKYVDLNVNKKG